MRRRHFIGLAGAVTTGLAARRLPAWRLQEAGGTPLRLPPEVRPDGLVLSARPGDVGIGGGRQTSAWMYNGSLPGPTIRLKSGERSRITLVNGLPEPTITHWHGLMVPEAADGHPRFAVAPGARYEYEFTVDQAPGLNWYHPHTHERTAYQVHRGLAGLVVIDDAGPLPGGVPPRERELLLVLQDRTIASDGSMPLSMRGPTVMAGYFGDTVLVNGIADAVATVTPDLWRLRILNGSAARVYDLATDPGQPLTIVGSDGGYLARPVSVDHCLLAPAERLDLLVDFSGARGTGVALRSREFTLPAGTRGPMMMGRGPMGMMMGRQGEPMPVMRFEVRDTSPVQRTPPATLPARPATPLPRGATEQRFVFSTMGMNHTINGKHFSLERPDIRVRAGSVERWTFVNDGPFPHPVHLHAAQFLVRARRGGRNALLPHEGGWKDTVLVAPSEEVMVDVHFGPHRGLFLLHCHNLQHEDMGMMLNVAAE